MQKVIKIKINNNKIKKQIKVNQIKIKNWMFKLDNLVLFMLIRLYSVEKLKIKQF
jgi:hypothetical protein